MQTSCTIIMKKEPRLIMKMLSNEVAYDYMANLCMITKEGDKYFT
jgi:hypothetical protein